MAVFVLFCLPDILPNELIRKTHIVGIALPVEVNFGTSDVKSDTCQSKTSVESIGSEIGHYHVSLQLLHEYNPA